MIREQFQVLSVGDGHVRSSVGQSCEVLMIVLVGNAIEDDLFAELGWQGLQFAHQLLAYLVHHHVLHLLLHHLLWKLVDFAFQSSIHKPTPSPQILASLGKSPPKIENHLFAFDSFSPNIKHELADTANDRVAERSDHKGNLIVKMLALNIAPLGKQRVLIIRLDCADQQLFSNHVLWKVQVSPSYFKNAPLQSFVKNYHIYSAQSFN